MNRKVLLVLVLLMDLTGCKGKNVSMLHSPDVSAIPPMVTGNVSMTNSIAFVPYTDHVSPNSKIMGDRERKTLTPMGQELVALLDDYEYAFNHNLPQQGEDKFGSVDTPSTEIVYGRGVIKIEATSEIKVLDLNSVGVVANVEVRNKADDAKPYWKGKQIFVFTVDGSHYFRLSYWNSPA